jgi:hypothetical protein
MQTYYQSIDLELFITCKSLTACQKMMIFAKKPDFFQKVGFLTPTSNNRSEVLDRFDINAIIRLSQPSHLLRLPPARYANDDG